MLSRSHGGPFFQKSWGLLAAQLQHRVERHFSTCNFWGVKDSCLCSCLGIEWALVQGCKECSHVYWSQEMLCGIWNLKWKEICKEFVFFLHVNCKSLCMWVILYFIIGAADTRMDIFYDLFPNICLIITLCTEKLLLFLLIPC